MTGPVGGLGLAPRDLEELIAALDPGRLVRYLRAHASPVNSGNFPELPPVTAECPQTRPQSPDLSSSPQWTVEQVAQRLGVTVRTVRRRCVAGKFPGAVRQSGRGRGWSIPADALEGEGT